MSTGSVLERLPRDADTEKLVAALERDGCAILEGALAPSQVDGLNRDFEKLVAATRPGVRHREEGTSRDESEEEGTGNKAAVDAFVNACADDLDAAFKDSSPDDVNQIIRDFYGYKTVRIDGLPGKSPTFVEMIRHPALLAAADHFLLPNCYRYTLNTGQLIEIRPGETEQALHRDEAAWVYFRSPRPQMSVEAMFALSDFTRENGATRIIPGSHRWDQSRTPEEHEIVAAEMPAGSAVIYFGNTLHGGGANRTPDEYRRGMFMGFCLGWLRTEENFFLSTPIEAVRGMPKQVQELLGYEAHLGIGVVDVGSPMKLLRKSSQAHHGSRMLRSRCEHSRHRRGAGPRWRRHRARTGEP